MRSSLTRLLVPAAALVSGCSDPPGPATLVPGCTAADTGRTVVAFAPFQARTFRGTELHKCVWVTGSGARYLAVPQFATDAEPRALTRYAFGTGGTLTAVPFVASASVVSPAVHFDNVLRRIERKLPAEATREAAKRAAAVSLRAQTLPRLQQVGDTRTFQVLSKIPANENEQLMFATVTASLRFIGANILIYVDQQAPTGASGLPDSALTSLGRWFDRDLYPLDISTFGTPSDVDANGHVIVLMTPVVNGLTPPTSCGVLVSGFFFGLDLVDQPNSNRGEVFYSFVADPQGRFGCARSVQTLEDNLPPVFVHEFQHMINFYQHRLLRGGADEETWLDEGLSHMAEEVTARFYENKYGPPPPPRIFNDTANIFIGYDLNNSYEFLESTPTTSLTVFDNTGTLPERGAAWLFLRWLADQRDSTIFSRLVQTDLTGIANVANVAGESFQSLFGDFAISLWTDSIPGHPRTSVPSRNRFKSRNLRVIYARLNTVAPDLYPREYPLVPRILTFGSTVQSSMYPGTMEFFESTSPLTDPAFGFRFARQTGEVFPDALKPQLGLFRLP